MSSNAQTRVNDWRMLGSVGARVGFSPWGRTKAGDIAKRTEGVHGVVNRLTIG